MKIQCDVCERDEASVFCVADEAALCPACDHLVHHANKLAGKHQRYSLHQPSSKQAPLCDVCQDRRAFLFCQQDRAVLCRECDLHIHKANEHTRKHTRFLLTGVKLSPAAALYSSSQSSSESRPPDVVPSIDSEEKMVGTTYYSKSTTAQSAGVAAPAPLNNLVPASALSEYLGEMLPGWRVEDFLDSSDQFPYGYCKSGGHDLMPLWDADLENNMSSFPTEKLGFWVPQADCPLNQMQNQSMDMAFRASNGNKEFTVDKNNKASREWSEDSSFVVPQITPSLSSSKRLRTS
ncbi:B-box zinc finger family protein [Striga asiatica]|uniref:B-box zinc finger family protein n=1 Tax=Striga asiatica TaxID=4170 RepID=A0A5A7PRK1_STRAF|nr:B-box zinc finger family protein [Striga asiatica]